MLRAFVIAMSVAVLTSMLGILASNSDEALQDDFWISSQVDEDFRQNFTQQFQNKIPEELQAYPIYELSTPELISQDVLTACPDKNINNKPASESNNDILGPCLPINAESKEGRTISINQDYRPIAMIIDGKPSKPLGFLNGITPDELQFGCVRRSNKTEHLLSQTVLYGTPEERLDAAQQLWRGHSRYYAVYVLNYAFEEKHPENRAFREEVATALLPTNLAKEITQGDCEWGTWLASLRPDADIVPVLIECLKNKPAEHLTEIMYALGKSRDARAFGPLLEILQQDDYAYSGFAALALGHLGRLEAEAPLIAVVERGRAFPVLHACLALGKLGTRNSLPCLVDLVETGRLNGGALNVRGCAQRAIEQIEAREP